MQGTALINTGITSNNVTDYLFRVNTKNLPSFSRGGVSLGAGEGKFRCGMRIRIRPESITRAE